MNREPSWVEGWHEPDDAPAPTLEDCIEWMAGYVFTEGRMPSERVCGFLNTDVYPAVLSYLRQYQQSRREPPPVATTPEPEQVATNNSGVGATP